MVRNEEKYQLATHYRKRGFSYSEISNLCGVSKSTVSNWFAGKRFSTQVKKDNQLRAGRENAKRIGLINKARQSERKRLYAEAVKTAELEFTHYKKDPLFIAGLMLYLGEGDNQDSAKIRIANSRFSVHRLFWRFITNYLGVPREKIRFWVLLYPDLDEVEIVKNWRTQLKLKEHQWYKNQVITGKSSKRTLHYGVGNTIIVSTVLKRKLVRWIELAEKTL
jgi:transcriptional regulator with XRE-family HTH domain